MNSWTSKNKKTGYLLRGIYVLTPAAVTVPLQNSVRGNLFCSWGGAL